MTLIQSGGLFEGAGAYRRAAVSNGRAGRSTPPGLTG